MPDDWRQRTILGQLKKSESEPNVDNGDTHQLVNDVADNCEDGNIDQQEEDQACRGHGGQGVVRLAYEACNRPVLSERHGGPVRRRGGTEDELGNTSYRVETIYFVDGLLIPSIERCVIT